MHEFADYEIIKKKKHIVIDCDSEYRAKQFLKNLREWMDNWGAMYSVKEE